MQMSLFAEPKQERHVEDERTYAAVMALRRRGHDVYRAGHDCLIDGRLVKPKTLREMAAARP